MLMLERICSCSVPLLDCFASLSHKPKSEECS